MDNLRNKTIRLAHSKPELRPHLLPLLKQASMLSFTPGTIEIALGYGGGKEQVDALLTGNWAIHKAIKGSGWTLTHAPSGMKVWTFPSAKKAKAILQLMVDSDPTLLNPSASDLSSKGAVLIPLFKGLLPFESIMRQAGLRNLGSRYGKKGDNWGVPGGSMMIRVGGRDLVLSEFVIEGWKLQKGSYQPDGVWRMADIEYQSKITSDKLNNWIAQVKAAPTMQEMRDEFRRTEGRTASGKKANALAKEILAQMGGVGRITAMTGAKNFVAGNNYVSFQFPNRRGPNYVKITLTSLDLYDMEFGRIVKWDLKNKKTINGVYNDQLKPIFEKETGLRLSL